MKTGQTRKSQLAIAKMIELRKGGMTFPKIAEHFGVDHTTVVYHWQKHRGFGKTGMKNRGNHRTMGEYNDNRPQRKISDDKCPSCELLWTSDYFCEYCKDKKLSP